MLYVNEVLDDSRHYVVLNFIAREAHLENFAVVEVSEILVRLVNISNQDQDFNKLCFYVMRWNRFVRTDHC